MLIRYFVRYRVSRRLRRGHGSSPQSMQKAGSPERRFSHVRIVQARTDLALPSSPVLQPRQRFFSRRYPMHTPQFMPQGATSAGSSACGHIFSPGFTLSTLLSLSTPWIGRHPYFQSRKKPGRRQCATRKRCRGFESPPLRLGKPRIAVGTRSEWPGFCVSWGEFGGKSGANSTARNGPRRTRTRRMTQLPKAHGRQGTIARTAERPRHRASRRMRR
jgi:hypothetical protein